jgi:hypothetical protein
METVVLLTLIFTVLLFPLTNWVVNNYSQLIPIKENTSFFLALIIALSLSFMLTMLSTDYAIKQVLLEFN